MADTHTLLAMTSDVVTAYVEKNQVAAADLPGLISSVYGALSGLDAEPADDQPQIEQPTPSQIRKSIRPDALISFEDGKPYKSLKRHLSQRGLSFADYKSKWGLPDSYPSVAPEYSARRSELAKSLGLGRKGGRPRKK